MAKARTIGNRIAPARFLVFFGMLALTIAAATLIAPWWRSVMIGFDLSAGAFVVGCICVWACGGDSASAARGLAGLARPVGEAAPCALWLVTGARSP